MIKLIAADVDGTLIQEGTHFLNPEYFDVIRSLRKKGVLFVAASGRNATSINRLFAPVSGQIGMISCSGAIWWKEGQPHVLSPIDYEDLEAIEQQVRRIPGAGFAADTIDQVMMHPGNEAVYRLLSDGYRNDVVLTRDGVFPRDEIYTKLAVHIPERIEELTQEIREQWSGRLHLCYAGGIWLDIIRPGCDKGAALGAIQEDLGILPEETVAFGDNGNDLEMLSKAGTSYAVAGAREEVKRAASHVIGPWQENSVLREMKNILAAL